jgi:hypothetical protein
MMVLNQPIRVPELFTVRWRNTAYGGVRNIVIEEGLVEYVAQYHNGYQSSGNIKIIHRYLPGRWASWFIICGWFCRFGPSSSWSSRSARFCGGWREEGAPAVAPAVDGSQEEAARAKRGARPRDDLGQRPGARSGGWPWYRGEYEPAAVISTAPGTGLDVRTGTQDHEGGRHPVDGHQGVQRQRQSAHHHCHVPPVLPR